MSGKRLEQSWANAACPPELNGRLLLYAAVRSVVVVLLLRRRAETLGLGEIDTPRH